MRFELRLATCNPISIEGLLTRQIRPPTTSGLWPKTVSPAYTGAKMFHSKPVESSHGVIQAVIFEIEPLTDSKVRPWRTILAQEAHVEQSFGGRSLPPQTLWRNGLSA